MLELLLRIKTINVNILLIKSKMSIFGYTCDSSREGQNGNKTADKNIATIRKKFEKKMRPCYNTIN